MIPRGVNKQSVFKLFFQDPKEELWSSPCPLDHDELQEFIIGTQTVSITCWRIRVCPLPPIFNLILAPGDEKKRGPGNKVDHGRFGGDVMVSGRVPSYCWLSWVPSHCSVSCWWMREFWLSSLVLAMVSSAGLCWKTRSVKIWDCWVLVISFWLAGLLFQSWYLAFRLCNWIGMEIAPFHWLASKTLPRSFVSPISRFRECVNGGGRYSSFLIQKLINNSRAYQPITRRKSITCMNLYTWQSMVLAAGYIDLHKLLQLKR